MCHIMYIHTYFSFVNLLLANQGIMEEVVKKGVLRNSAIIRCTPKTTTSPPPRPRPHLIDDTHSGRYKHGNKGSKSKGDQAEVPFDAEYFDFLGGVGREE